MWGDVLALVLVPCCAGFVFVGMHTWLGLQVIRRNIIFADLALAQLSALGAIIGVGVGHPPGSLACFAYALITTLLGAVLLTVTRRPDPRVSQEAVIGVIYVVAAALTILVIDRAPQGAEHVKRMLVGNILTITVPELLKLVVLYAAVGLLHVVFRTAFLASSAASGSTASSRMTAVWDFIFYGSFGVVVTSSVAHAGVLLVFSFLIIPAIVGTLASRRTVISLLTGWFSGAVATLVGLAASVMWDTPTGPTMVVCFAAVLLLAVPILAGVRRLRTGRPLFGRQVAFAGVGLACLAVSAQGGWLMMAPGADQPLLSALEQAVGISPDLFMTPTERGIYGDARAVEEEHRKEIDRLRDAERTARWQGKGLSEEELRRIASYQQTFSEMSRGERFVQTQLLAKARERQAWRIGLPALLGALMALCGIIWQWKRSINRSQS